MTTLSTNFQLPAPELSDAADIQEAVAPLRDALDTLLLGFQQAAPVIGAEMGYAGTGDPPGGKWMLADGRLIDRTVYAEFFGAVGHRYNGGVDPGGNMVRIPDKRGRVSVGADNMGTALGAAGRLPNSNRAGGQNGGEERHATTVSEMPSHSHDMNGSDSNAIGGGPLRTVHFDTGLQTDWAITGSSQVAVVSQGGGQAHNNLQPYEVDNMIVRVA